MKLLDLFVGTPFSEALGWTLLHSLWEGLIVAAALAVFLSVVRSPRTRYPAAGGIARNARKFSHHFHSVSAWR